MAESLSSFHSFFYSKNEDNEEPPDLQDSLLDDYADDYEEYDHDMEAEHVDRECQDTDEEKGNDEGHSYHDKLDVDDDDDEQVERYKDDDIISKHSQSSRGSESKNSDRSRTGSIN